ncbi:LCP family protein [Cohnella faecalis]|uniref:Cell envelope-related transcriptional attenuator domain-containing protein n=1 Tax=Cohnella faecalis TaxID=2315694 RepID=A0A398CRD8_9BACL|nr:LCP family protein [Cohnella faecalis]RIE03829.1 hypothetical protein D3H35_09760 [Cohnella faecalis]
MKRWIWISAGAAVVILLGIVGTGGYAYFSLKHTAKQVYVPLPDKPKYVSKDTELKRPETIDTSKLSPFTVLLLGVDERQGDRGRSDTILVLTVNPKQEKALLFNIPRDTRTEIAGRKSQDKINHAYAFEGVAGSLATVENFLDMPIDYYVEVNMEGFKSIVDTLNGVDVVNAFAFSYEGSEFPAGEQHLDGDQALKFSRMRYDDPRGDFGRNERQRQIVRDVLHRASQWNNLWELPDVLKTVGNHVRTNMTFDEIQDLATKYRTRIAKVESTEIRGKGSMINGIYYYLVDEKERDRIHSDMKKLLMEPS